jgi:hypothetical protein
VRTPSPENQDPDRTPEESFAQQLEITDELFQRLSKRAEEIRRDQELVFQRVGRVSRSGVPRPCAPPCARLRHLSDLIPGPRLRRRVGKLLADQEHHIDALLKQRRAGAALWVKGCTWLIFLWMILASPVAALMRLMSRRSA